MKSTARRSYSGKTISVRQLAGSRGTTRPRPAKDRAATSAGCAAAVLEPLEERSLPSSVWLADGVLNIQGGSDPRLGVNVAYRHGQLKVHVRGQRVQDFLRSAVSQIKIVGTSSGNDRIILTRNEPVPAYIQAGNGNDVIAGGAGNDTIICGSGRDRVWGRGGNDVIYGGAGADSLYGGPGNDQLHAGSGNDLLDGGPGQNRLFGGTGRDILRNGMSDMGRVGHRKVVESDYRPPVSSPKPTPSVGDTPPGNGGTSGIAGASDTGSTGTSASGSTGSSDSGSTGSGATGSGSTGSGATGSGSTGSGATGSGSTGSGATGSGSTGTGTTGSGSTGTGTTGSGSTGTGSTGSGSTGSTGSGSTGTGSTGTGTGTGSSADQNAPTAIIQFLDQGGMAGHTIGVDGLSSVIRNGNATDATFHWDFGDPGSAYNTLPGFNAAHRYTAPGTYTVTLTITDKAGESSTTSGTVQIAADTRRLIYVNSQTGNDGNAGTSADYPVQTLARAAQLIGDNTEVLLCRGQTYDLADTVNINSKNVLVGAYGQGANPTIMKMSGSGNACFYTATSAQDISFQNLSFDSIWGLDSVYGAKKVPANGLVLGGKNLTVVDCQFHNLTNAVDTESEPRGVLVQGNSMGPELRGYGIWGVGTDHVYIGNTMTNSTQEHLIRADEGAGGVALSHVLIAYNNLSRPTDSKGSIELRTCTWFYVANNTINGGTLRVGLQEQNKAQVPNWASMQTGNGVLENNTTTGIFWNFRPGVFNVAVRNNVINADNQPAILVECIKPGYDQVRKTSDVRFCNNTVVNNGAAGCFMLLDGNATGLVLDNNVLVAPNLSLSGNGQAGAIYVTNGDGTLNSFTQIANNVWPALPQGSSQPGLNYIGPTSPDKTDYVANSDWETLAPVSNDTFQNVTLPADTYSITIQNVTAGAIPQAA